ncbi:MAG: MBOAT family protein [Betaproteobacteria bacterium]|nr:MBOAT family protein [Betaproteobacteria bacterium]
MLFNSYAFVLVFLPLSLLIHRGLRRAGLDRGSIFALTLLSLFFYGWWNPVYLLLIVPMVLANFGVGRLIMACRVPRPQVARALLILGLAGNLAVLGWFKYANFFVNNVNALFGADLYLATIVLPLGISFFTFQKIAFLVDAYRGKVDRLDLLEFSLFVTFFPQLIAGPIVHHREVLPQFRQRGEVMPNYLAMGVTIFAIGLAKKVLLADTAAPYASAGFDAAAAGAKLDCLAAWSSALAYTAQLYFDFSGYSDMAVGAALLFGIRLPINFASPYKATSLIDFWRRWHVTLSRFLRDYVYFSLGGNQRGRIRRYLNLLLTMLLGGLWHGAGWTFVIWGALHGLGLTVNHGWRAVRPRLRWLPETPGRVERRLGQALTIFAVVLAWVFFRAADTVSAVEMLKAMAGMNGVSEAGGNDLRGLVLAAGLLLIALLAPNTQEITGYTGPSEADRSDEIMARPGVTLWRPRAGWAALVGAGFGISVLSLSRVSEFLYFQF